MPHIEEVRADGTEIVMERIDGPIMMDAMVRPPWKLGDHLRLLADLHDRLHQIDGPDWLPGMPDGGRPAAAPRSAPAQRDHVAERSGRHRLAERARAATRWPTSRSPTRSSRAAASRCRARSRWRSTRCGRPLLRRTFAKRYLGRDFYRRVAEMAELKCFDENMDADEIRALRRLLGGPSALQRRLRDDGSPRPRHPSASASEPAHRCESIRSQAGAVFPLPQGER